MRRNKFKSFALLFVFNSFYLSLLFYFLPLPYLVLILIFFIVLNVWLLFFPEFFFMRKLKARPAFLTDSKGILKIWKAAQKTSSTKRATCYIVEEGAPFSFYFSGFRADSAVFSKSLLELLTLEEAKALVCYFFTVFSTGWGLFFTVFSFFCSPVWILFFLLEAPFRFFYSIGLVTLNRKERKKEMIEKKGSLGMKKQRGHESFSLLVLKLLSLFFYRTFLYLDRKTHQKPEGKALGRALWKVESLYKTETLSLSFWMLPLFFGNPLTFRFYGWYLSFQPRLRQRVKALVGYYPP